MEATETIVQIMPANDNDWVQWIQSRRLFKSHPTEHASLDRVAYFQLVHKTRDGEVVDSFALPVPVWLVAQVVRGEELEDGYKYIVGRAVDTEAAARMLQPLDDCGNCGSSWERQETEEPLDVTGWERTHRADCKTLS